MSGRAEWAAAWLDYGHALGCNRTEVRMLRSILMLAILLLGRARYGYIPRPFLWPFDDHH